MTPPAESTAARWLFGAGLLLLAAMLIGAALLVWRDPLHYYFDDAFFYLQIARSVAEGQGPQFTAGVPTNGYHPLWMLICALVAAVTPSVPAQIAATSWLTVFLNIAWTLLALRTFAGLFPRHLVIAGTLLGFPYVFFFSFGMESALALLLLLITVGAVVRHGEAPSRKALVSVALAAGLTVFARLDLAIAVAPLALFAAWQHWVKRRDLPGLALSAVIGAAAPAAWLLYNKLVFGAFTPISGLLKMSQDAGWRVPGASGIVYLYLMMVLIALAGALFGGVRKGRAIVVVAALGQIGFFLYLAGSGSTETWSWYFAPLAGLMGLFLSPSIETGRSLVEQLAPRLGGAAALLAAAAVLLSSPLLFVRYISAPIGIERAYYEGPGALGAQARAHGVDTVFAFDRPGVVRVLDGLNVVPADGLTSNLVLQREVRAKGLPWLFERQGIDGVLVPHTDFLGGNICGEKFLGSTMLVCRTELSGVLEPVEMRVYSRLDGAELGRIPLTGRKRLIASPTRDYDLLIL